MPAARPAKEPDLFSDYHRIPGVADELFDAEGRMRPVWARFVERFARLAPAEIAARFERGNQYLRDAGVFYRQYSGDPLAERDWPLSHIPVVLHDSEWEQICTGLAERADLLEQVVADLYGEGRLVREGHLPASLIAASPQWLRPMVGIEPAGGHHLHFLAFEIGRSPDGSWLVLGDRVQAPSGAGFALENRMATGRIFPERFPRAYIHRLAGFFADFRAQMKALAKAGGDMEARAAILTPGPSNDTYYEHTYIARYLGLMLLEGEDLLVENGELKVRTIEGPQPIGLLWRRIDAAFADPLELHSGSQIGTPGLVETVRRGNLAMVNALGAGVVEMRAMMAFLPRISEVLTGKPLALSNIATWWCGGAAERDYVKKHAGEMLIGPALSPDLPYDIETGAGLGGQGGDTEAWIDAEGPSLVGQEAVALSTTPAWVTEPGQPLVEGRILPRPMTIRVFAARTAEGWRFMKGGYARIGKAGDASALGMQKGGSVADVWIVSDRLVPKVTLTPKGEASFQRLAHGVLPSRSADNLFWLGRYVERTEDAIRLIRAYHLRLAATDNPADPLLRRLRAFISGYGIDVAQPMPEALLDRIGAARACAAKVRDRFSTDGWAALVDLHRTASVTLRDIEAGDDAARAMFVLVRKMTAFSGLVQDNMYRFQGWRFLSLGRALERADGLTALLHGLAEPGAPEGALDLAVEVADSVITHRRRYAVETSRDTVVDLLALDADNPRSILFQLRVMREQAAALPGAEDNGRLAALSRAILPLETRLSVVDIEDITAKRLLSMRGAFGDISDLITDAYLR
ncbi:circularly permuted type 2 ATP-grasp protein [Pararhodobacter sp. CCB-MM2]|uniref:circularly permuted type 2 ATP-grasp protein n=1 Tax=Pararhodobacter sp. CCB-MM2 TaxID=1786003 RepID=UPI00082C7F4A|nr:circularly permuted type 2 ATP-grasp protein [Pararhodobacter sp. CCB-MM2]